MVARKQRDGHAILVDAATSARMAGIRQRDTTPELAVRRALTKLGIRYRVRNRELPGSPDIANRSRHWVIFVHGCYWHRHPGCRRTTTPSRNRSFWEAKFARNIARDHEAALMLEKRGYRALIVWECETESYDELVARLSSFCASSV